MSSLIEVKHLKKYYNKGEIKALDDVSVNIERGDVMVVIGPSGSGKSTLLRSLNLLEVPTAGEIDFDGVDITKKKVKNEAGKWVKLDLDKHRQKMGMVFQHFNLFPHMTILDNMTLAPIHVKHMPKAEAEQKAHALLERVGLGDRAEAYPIQLSGGQKQRIAIAGVIAMEPECIVLDEATAMLDPAGRREVLDTVHRLNRERGITVVLITHHMSEAEDADRVIVMNDGTVAMDGTPCQVFSRVEELHAFGLAAPDTVELLYELRQAGLPVALDSLTVDQCADTICRALGAAEGK